MRLSSYLRMTRSPLEVANGGAEARSPAREYDYSTRRRVKYICSSSDSARPPYSTIVTSQIPRLTVELGAGVVSAPQPEHGKKELPHGQRVEQRQAREGGESLALCSTQRTCSSSPSVRSSGVYDPRTWTDWARYGLDQSDDMLAVSTRVQ